MCISLARIHNNKNVSTQYGIAMIYIITYEYDISHHGSIFYSLSREILKEVPDTKYLGFQIDSNVAFSKKYIYGLSKQEATLT